MQESVLAEPEGEVDTVTSSEEFISEESTTESSMEESSEEIVSYETAVQLFNASQGVQIQWNPAPGVFHYSVYRKTGDKEAS